MRASECCIFRMICASFLGSGGALAALWADGALRAVMLAPIGGSLAAAATVSLIWVAGRLTARSASSLAPEA